VPVAPLMPIAPLLFAIACGNNARMLYKKRISVNLSKFNKPIGNLIETYQPPVFVFSYYPVVAPKD
jgi:hypothetical protein